MKNLNSLKRHFGLQASPYTLMTLAIAVISFVGLPGESFAQGKTDADGVKFFEEKIRPVLVRECYGCHAKQTGQIKGGLQVDTKTGLLVGGDSGAALVPGSLEDSPLWSAINYEDYSMPPNKQLSDEIIEDFRTWIEMGAPDPRGQNKSVTISSTVTDEDIKKGRKFWAFKAPRQPEIPNPANADWAKSDIDRFVVNQLESRGMQPAVDADPNSFLRRLTFDLIGLPPTPEQIKAFAADWGSDQDRAISQAVDRLLESPQFGERWGRHWLDLARYAESTGKEVNATFPNAWRYRDYVIDSFNEDKPYDRFVQEQIAGDLLPVRNNEQWAENLIATGFLALGPKTLVERNPRQFRADLIDEQIDVTTRVVLGVSVACARCHDHKFDPIPQEDYYAMAGIFASTETWYGTAQSRQNRRSSDLILLPIDDPGEFEKPVDKKHLATLTNEMDKLMVEYRELGRERRLARRTKDGGKSYQQANRKFQQAGARINALQTAVDSYDEDGNPKTFCMGTQPAEPMDMNLLVRGEVDQPAQAIPRGFVRVLGSNKKIRKDSTGRLELARWMTDESNPLAARVMVNRIWQHLLGQGLVTTPENFGATGLPPTHPELLDHLAIEFMNQDWSIKAMIRQIANSRTYRMSSAFHASHYEVDPDNNYLWRTTPQRLDAESIRDSLLAVSGQLDINRPAASIVAQAGETIVRNGQLRNIRGAVIDQAVNSSTSDSSDSMSEMSSDSNNRGRNRRRPASRTDRQKYVLPLDPDVNYRSVYLPIVRDDVPRALSVFDFAESSMVIGTRELSNTPDQGLFFLNSPLVIKASRELANRIMESTSDIDQQIEQAFLVSFGRDATEQELSIARQFFDEFEVAGKDNKKHAEKLSCLCQAILASAEFRIVN